MNDKKSEHVALAELVTGEKRIVFVPNVGNLGDALIAHATYSFLDAHRISYEIARVTDVVRGACILVGGGGNLIEGRYNDLSTFLGRCGRYNRLIILPHTIVGNTDLWLSLQDNLQVFARERETLRFLTSIGIPSQHLFLADDMAFWLAGSLPQVAIARPDLSLVCLRRDAESSNAVAPPPDNFDVSGLMLHDWTDQDVARLAAEIFITIIGRYRSILTDRLHVAIAGFLMNRQVTLLPNSYFKNREVYASSLRQAPHVRFLELAAGETLPPATWC